MAPVQIRARPTRQALANLQTPEGQAYLKNVEQKLAAFEEPCLKETDSDPRMFEMQGRIAKDGAVELAQTEQRPNAFTVCVMRGLYQSFLKKQTPFTPAPRASYWLLLELDPTRIVAGSR